MQLNMQHDTTYPRTFCGIPLLPAGDILQLSDLPDAPALPAHLRHLPILAGSTTNNDWALGSKCRGTIGTGQIRWQVAGENVCVLTIRFQFGQRQQYWLVDPADTRVWAMLGNWSAAKTAIIALYNSRSERVLIRLPLPGDVGTLAKAELSRLPEASPLSYLTAAFSIIASKLLVQQATSDIRGIRKLKSVDVALLTSHKVDAGFDLFLRNCEERDAASPCASSSAETAVH